LSKETPSHRGFSYPKAFLGFCRKKKLKRIAPPPPPTKLDGVLVHLRVTTISM